MMFTISSCWLVAVSALLGQTTVVGEMVERWKDYGMVVEETDTVNIFHSSYMGCWKLDSVNFPHKSTIENVDVASCRKACREVGYTFAALNKGTDCHCGEAEGEITPTDGCYNDELKKCDFNEDDVCGGAGFAASVYRVCDDPYTYALSDSPFDCVLHCHCKNGCKNDGTCVQSECGVGQQLEVGPNSETICTPGCPENKYGLNCSFDSDPVCMQGVMHPSNGYCVHGCVSTDAVGIFCHSGASATGHNANAEFCPLCIQCSNKFCDGSGGGTYYGCPNEWSGQYCEGCEDGYFGSHCHTKCVEHCIRCIQGDGRCEECVPGRYGDICESCSTCVDNDCDMSGNCDQGCIDGYYGPLCDGKCSEGCVGDVCLRDTAACPNGCKTGYWGSDRCENTCGKNCLDRSCSTTDGVCGGCNLGHYGDDCSEDCSTCANDACNRHLGFCMEGCVTGFHGEKCKKVCHEHCYGKQCEKSNGACTDGCERGFQGMFCSTAYDDEEDDQEKETVGAGEGLARDSVAAYNDKVSLPGGAGNGTNQSNDEENDEENDSSDQGSLSVGAGVGIGIAASIGFLLIIAVIVLAIMLHSAKKEHPVTQGTVGYSIAPSDP